MFSSEATRDKVGPPQGETDLETINKFKAGLDPDSMGFDGPEGE